MAVSQAPGFGGSYSGGRAAFQCRIPCGTRPKACGKSGTCLFPHLSL